MLVEILLGANVLAVSLAATLDWRKSRQAAAVEEAHHRELTEKVETALRASLVASSEAKEEIKFMRQNLDMALSQSYIAVAPPHYKQNRLTIVRKDGTGWQRVGERDLDHPDIQQALDNPVLALVDVEGTRIDNREQFKKWDAEDW